MLNRIALSLRKNNRTKQKWIVQRVIMGQVDSMAQFNTPNEAVEGLNIIVDTFPLDSSGYVILAKNLDKPILKINL